MAVDVPEDPAKLGLGKRQLPDGPKIDDKAVKGVASEDQTDGDKKGAGTRSEDNKSKPNGEKPSSLKIRIDLNLDVEIHLTARIKGDITIGLL